MKSYWRLIKENPAVAILCITTAITTLSQGVASPVLPLFARQFHASTFGVGFIISSFIFARLLISLPSGLLSERTGRRLLVVGGPLISAIGGFLSAMAGSLWELSLYRFISGLGNGIFQTGALIYLTDTSKPENRGKIMGLFQGSFILGVTLGPALGGPLADLFGLRAPFVAVGAFSLAATAWAYFRLPETHKLSPKPLEPNLGKPSMLAALRNPSQEIKQILWGKDFLLIGWVTLAFLFTIQGSQLTLIPLIGKETLGLSPSFLGLIFFLMSLGNIATIPFSGILSDTYGRKVIIAVGGLGMALCLVVFAMATNVWIFILAGTLMGLSSGFKGPAPAAYVGDLAPAKQRGLAMGVFRLYNDVGGVIGPLVLGRVADALGLGAGLLINAVIFGLFNLLFLALARETLNRKVPAIALEKPS